MRKIRQDRKIMNKKTEKIKSPPSILNLLSQRETEKGAIIQMLCLWLYNRKAETADSQTDYWCTIAHSWKSFQVRCAKFNLECQWMYYLKVIGWTKYMFFRISNTLHWYSYYSSFFFSRVISILNFKHFYLFSVSYDLWFVLISYSNSSTLTICSLIQVNNVIQDFLFFILNTKWDSEW